MRLTTIGYAVLDARIAEFGQDAVVMDVATRVSHGERPVDIARSFGVPYIVLKKWMEENGSELMGLAKRAHADVLVSNALEAVHDASVEDVAVARLKADTYLKVAGKQDKVSWGDSQAMGGGSGNITIVIGSVVKDEKVVESDEI